jgi:hypothetical protein
MSKIRINDLARELEVKSKEILDALTSVGVTEKKTHSSSLEDHEADLVRKHLRGRSDAAPSGAKSSSRAAHGEEEIKTKIDLSHISRPGDVLRAITQLRNRQPPRRPRKRRQMGRQSLDPPRRRLRPFRRNLPAMFQRRQRREWLLLPRSLQPIARRRWLSSRPRCLSLRQPRPHLLRDPPHHRARRQSPLRELPLQLLRPSERQ